jgi:signal transduction histidine kinase
MATETAPTQLSSLASLPATDSHRMGAAIVALAFGAITLVFGPFAGDAWPHIPAFVPVYQGVTAACYLLACYILVSDFRQGGSLPLLCLAAGSFWTGAMLVLQLLSVPNLFVPGRLIGGDQTTIHLWMWWHLGPPVYSLAFAWFEARRTQPVGDPRERSYALLTAGSVTVFAVLAVFGIVTRGHSSLPHFNVGPDYSLLNTTGVGPAVTLLTVLALAAVWRVTRGRTVLQLWLAISLVALVFDNVITLLGARRDSVGWYVGRVEALMSAAMVLFVYLHQVGRMTRGLAASAAELQEEAARRSRVEAELVHSSKMDALGQLTGGIAHDFANLLQVVRNDLQIVSLRTRDEATAKAVASASRTVERGERLIQQLLAFARRQPLEFTVFDVNERLSEMDDLLKRTAGHATLRLELSPELWPALADAQRFDLAVVNLVANARDALKDSGGEIVVRTRNAADALPDGLSGEFVCLSVLDNGQGIDPSIMDRVWEPFFTTKPAGKGTGLGLSTVYGFVKQSGGSVSITSSVGMGTEVRLYLPKGTQAQRYGAQKAPEPSTVVRLARR